ncbi:MAG TPA: OsmC family protein [Thermoanaerobaculaceae bacterium]|nr:OsmC family protein [Thermoanaerobaculaceae bacterium]HPS79132.1 OsmC family protein [Thermoanaerobaculaceae bacterium]
MADVATLVWQEGLRFEARSGSGHILLVDSSSRPEHQGPSPMEIVLVGVAGCMSMDVISILQKMQQPVTGLQVHIAGQRNQNHPKYFTAVELRFEVRGRGVARERVERAIELSRTTYCSAIGSLRPDCQITTTVEIIEDPAPAS